jgi:hypothetical protein
MAVRQVVGVVPRSDWGLPVPHRPSRHTHGNLPPLLSKDVTSERCPLRQWSGISPERSVVRDELQEAPVRVPEVDVAALPACSGLRRDRPFDNCDSMRPQVIDRVLDWP